MTLCQAMLDIEGAGKVTYEELRHAIREGLSAGAGVKAKNNMELDQVGRENVVVVVHTACLK